MQDNESEEIKSTLVSKNVTIKGRRTSIRLEPEMWAALKDIARRERCKIHDICTLVHIRKREGTSLTAAIRVFLMLYYRASSTEIGHMQAGHGSFEDMIGRANISEEALGRPIKKQASYKNVYYARKGMAEGAQSPLMY
jgi:predicted DNA-binding ribbon-helix-helix protein